jgi:AraC-like DNA-binding protein
MVCREKQRGVNIMFFVHDRKLEKQLENFNFRLLRPDGAFVPVLMSILDQIEKLKPSQEFIDAAVSYYIHLVLESGLDAQAMEPGPESLADRCLNFIEQNYMNQLRLEDIADHIGRTKSYTSFLVSNTTGQTVVEHLNAVRVKHACTLLAYSDAEIEHVSEVCGFTNVKNFCRVFKNIVGTTPTRYRTSHATEDMKYYGVLKALDAPYN